MKQRIVIVRSDKCTNSSGENSAEFVFPVPIVLQQNEDAYVQLMRVSFPHSFYLINEFTDALIVSDTTYTLTHGCYNAVTMLTHLRQILSLSVDYSPARFRYTFSSTDAFQIGSNSTVLRILGIKASQCGISTTSLEGGAVSDLHGIHLIKVISNFDVDSLDSSVSGGYDSHLLAMVPVEEDMHAHSSFKYEHWSPPSKHRQHVHDRIISELKLSLLDIDNHPVHFNCCAWSAKVAIIIIKNDKENLFLYQNASQARTQDVGPSDEIRDEELDAASDAGASQAPRALRQKQTRAARTAKRKPARKRK